MTVEPSTEQTINPAPPPACIASYSFDSHDSVLSEQRSRAGAKRWDDFAKRYPAAYIDLDADHPVELVASAQIGKAPLLWFTADYADAVVNAAVLTELKIVDATSLGVGERVQIGALTEFGLQQIDRETLGGREFTKFLLKAGVIQTFVHIGATVCLLAETEGDQTYRAEFSGEHEYYTNGENHDEFGFVVEITADGGIAITGAAPKPYAPVTP